MATNFIITNNTMTYAEYINHFMMIRSIKRNLKQLSFPLDEIPYLSSMTEEDIFLRKWDIETFGLNSSKNDISSKMWLQKETSKFTQ